MIPSLKAGQTDPNVGEECAFFGWKLKPSRNVNLHPDCSSFYSDHGAQKSMKPMPLKVSGTQVYLDTLLRPGFTTIGSPSNGAPKELRREFRN